MGFSKLNESISLHFAVDTTAEVCENRIYGTLAREKSGLAIATFMDSEWCNPFYLINGNR
jgi:hypothetical protein